MSAGSLRGYRELWDWRRRMAELYATVRGLEPPRLAWQCWRESRDELFRSHPQSPLEPAARGRFAGLPLFPYDPALRFLVDLDPADDASPEAMPAGSDGEVVLTPFGRTRGLARRLGGELSLYWIGGYGGGVLLPFKDATSGRETYGGGRYLLDTLKSADLGCAADGRVILDFNFAYHPSCVHSERWVCPLAPAANRLPEAVRAGERLPRQAAGWLQSPVPS